MYRKKIKHSTVLEVNNSYEGETIETKVERIVTQGEPIKDGAPLIYTDRKDGVKAEYDIRTDRWEIAIDAMDAVTRTHIGKRQERIKERDGKPESTEATDNQGVAS